MSFLDWYIIKCITSTSDKGVYVASSGCTNVILKIYRNRELAYNETLALSTLYFYGVSPTIIDCGKFEDTYYVATNMIEGCLLSKVNITNKLAEKVGMVIATIHNAGVYHGDLHKGNIIVDRDTNVVVLDFEFSTLLASTNPKRSLCFFKDLHSLLWDFPRDKKSYLLKGYFSTLEDDILREEIRNVLKKYAPQDVIKSLDKIISSEC